MNRLLIYIGDSALDLFAKSVLAITYSLVDIRDLKVRIVSFSSSLELPPTQNNLQSLGNPDNLHSQSTIPYSQLDTRALFNGVEYFSGRIIINEFNKNIRVSVYDRVIDIFESVRGKKLHELNYLTNTAWNASDIDGFRAATAGVTAPVINWGDFDTATPAINSTLYLPSYFYMEIVTAILNSTGYDFEGDILTDTNFTDLVIPFGAKEFEYVDAFQSERSFTATNSIPQVESSPAGSPATFKVDVDTIVSQGANEWFDTINSRFQIPDFTSTGNIGNVEFSIYYDITVEIGTGSPGMFIELFLAKNGVQQFPSIQYAIDTDPTYNFQGTFGNNFTGATQVAFADLDYFEVHVRFDDLGVGTINSITINEIVFSGYVTKRINRNFLFHNYLLPDIEQIDILEDFFVRAGAFLKLQNDGSTVTVKTIKEVISNKAAAKDWTLKRVGTPDKIDFNYQSYAQENYFSYAEGTGVNPTLGRGSITIENTNLNLRSDYFTTVFENCLTQPPDDTIEINMAYIPVYDGTSVTIDDFVNEPGLKLLTLRDKLAEEPDITFNATPRSDYKVAYFVDEAQIKDTGFQYFLGQYYAELQDSFDKTKLVTRQYRLDITDVFSDVQIIFDTDSYFLINKIDKFIPGKITSVELLRVY